ncbi:MAG: hypothetical protein QNJ90_04390 [Planctomycetota bacterium]|nr:hypothetical protein [Planctomycetota bacterium]
MPRLIDAPGGLRLAAACFACLVLAFALLAQANLWYMVGAGKPPSPRAVLLKYHGDPDTTLLHDVLDARRPIEDPRNMSQFLGGSSMEDPVTIERRKQVLDWVEAGAPESGWEAIAPIFTEIQSCGACHAPGGEQASLPLTTYEEVLPIARYGSPTPLGPLLISAHNHLFGFAVAAVLLSVGLCFTRVRGPFRGLLILAASGGAALDVGSWFLTRQWGEPFHLLVMAGGGLFGVSTGIMALAILRDALAGGVQAESDAAA